MNSLNETKTSRNYTYIFEKHSKKGEYTIRELTKEDYDKGNF